PLGPVADFSSLVVALVCGGITSRFGGFWFYPGAIISFIVFREICLRMRSWTQARAERKRVEAAELEQGWVELQQSQRQPVPTTGVVQEEPGRLAAFRERA